MSCGRRSYGTYSRIWPVLCSRADAMRGNVPVPRRRGRQQRQQRARTLRRGRRPARARTVLDDGLTRLTELWSGEFEPRPVQTPRIPIWVAGRWPHPAARQPRGPLGRHVPDRAPRPGSARRARRRDRGVPPGSAPTSDHSRGSRRCARSSNRERDERARFRHRATGARGGAGAAVARRASLLQRPTVDYFRGRRPNDPGRPRWR
jgi:hypothetical protein